MIRYPIIVLSFLILLGGCAGLPEARAPLSPPGAEAYDPRIVGRWFAGAPDEDEFYFDLKIRSEPNVLDGTGIIIDMGDEDYIPGQGAEVVWLSAIVHPSRLDGSTYYNIRRLAGTGDDYGSDPDNTGYIILKADLIDARTIELCLMDNGMVGDAIDAGGITGKLIKEDAAKGIKLEYNFIDVSQDELAGFIRGNLANGLFDACMTFRKLV